VEKIAFAQEESDGDAELVRAWEGGKATPIAEGMSRAFWLHKPAYRAGFWVQNTGKVYGGEVSCE
jgi:beta-glucosidase